MKLIILILFGVAIRFSALGQNGTNIYAYPGSGAPGSPLPGSIPQTQIPGATSPYTPGNNVYRSPDDNTTNLNSQTPGNLSSVTPSLSNPLYNSLPSSSSQNIDTDPLNNSQYSIDGSTNQNPLNGSSNYSNGSNSITSPGSGTVTPGLRQIEPTLPNTIGPINNSGFGNMNNSSF
jgi:hypothetical protein